MFAGTAVDNTVLAAKSGPLLVRMIEYLILLPGGIGSGESEILTDKSDAAIDVPAFAGARLSAFAVLPKNAPNNVITKERASIDTAKIVPKPDA